MVLTELAYEKAKRLDFQLITDRLDNPPAAPVRPYISAQHTPRPVPTVSAAPAVAPKPAAAQAESDIENRIRSAVIARLGNQVDAKLLDSIIQRVVKGVGLK